MSAATLHSLTTHCKLCQGSLDFTSSVVQQSHSGDVITFSQVWSLQCRHLLHTECTYQLLEYRRMRSFTAKPPGSSPQSFPVTKVWSCPVTTCTAMYCSILSHRGHGWTIAPDMQGAIKALVPYSLHSLLGAYATRDCVGWGTLEELEEMQLHLGSLHRVRIRPQQSILSTAISIEFATHWYVSSIDFNLLFPIAVFS